MATIRVMTKTNVTLVKARVLEALGPLAKELGVKFSFEPGRFGDDSFRSTLRCEVDSPEAKAMNARVAQGEASLLGLPASVVGQIIMVDATPLQVTGFNLRRPKFPVSAKHARSGRPYKLTVAQVRNALARAGRAA